MARKMKDSGIEWIGEIPEGWEVATIGHLFSVTAGGDAKPHLYSFVQDTEHPYPVYTNSSNPNQIYAYTSAPIFNENTITVTGRGDIGHAFYRSTKFDAIIRLLVLAPKLALDCRYYAYWIDNVSIFFTNSAAVGQLSAQQISPYKTCYLPLCEQHSIANHLDFYCSKIEHILAEIQNSIQEYKKLKQAVITQAVTKGVRGEREMKDSGVEWIGEIPAEWSITKIKSGVTKIGSGKTPSGGAETYTDSGVIFLRSQNVYDCTLNLESPTYISPEVDATMKSTRVLPDDVILNITGGSIGRCSIVPKTLGLANVNQHVCIIRTNPLIFLPKYMQYFWVSTLGHLAIDLYQTGGNREGMSADAIRNTPIPYAPLNEQKEIADYLDAKCAEIDGLIAKKEQLVKELESYKKSLIYEVVTGKREV